MFQGDTRPRYLWTRRAAQAALPHPAKCKHLAQAIGKTAFAFEGATGPKPRVFAVLRARPQRKWLYDGLMFGGAWLVVFALSGVPPKDWSDAGRNRSWLSAVVVGAKLTQGNEPLPEAVEGYADGVPFPLLVVDLVGLNRAVRAEVHTALAFAQMKNAAERVGVSLHVNSGFRTQAGQREVFDLYRRGRGPLAARPGFSNHQSGFALDLDTRSPKVRAWLGRHASRFGFVRTVAGENWHFEFRDKPVRVPQPARS